jgi:hypothetical protein
MWGKKNNYTKSIFRPGFGIPSIEVPKMQRFSDAKYFRYFFHLVGCLLFAYSLWYHAKYLPHVPGMEHMRHYGGMLKYLTVWDLVSFHMLLISASSDDSDELFSSS